MFMLFVNLEALLMEMLMLSASSLCLQHQTVEYSNSYTESWNIFQKYLSFKKLS